jgi:hypothetical protein
MKHLMKNSQLKLKYSDPFETDQKALTNTDSVNVEALLSNQKRYNVKVLNLL